jgi:hypothetical protein
MGDLPVQLGDPIDNVCFEAALPVSGMRIPGR